MATTYPLPTLASTISATGIVAPSFSDIYQSLQASFQAIYGTDAYLDPDSQDGQLLAIVAQAISDANSATIAVYNSFSPATSQGNALSNNVKINGIARLVPTNSTVDVLIVGVVGSIITNGVVADTNQNQWALPASVIIPSTGQITVTATCTKSGAITALAGTVTTISTPSLGWQTVNNPLDAVVGQPVETDAALRQRQTVSVALPSLTVLDGIVGAIESLTGVTSVAAYENDTGTTDANGIPAHTLSMVVRGGDSTAIATAIATKKTPGAGTYGTTTIAITDASGVSHNINFYRPTTQRITVAVSVHPITGAYTSAVGLALRQAIVDYINALAIGTDVYRASLFLPAQLYGAADSLSYNVTALTLAIFPAANGTADLTIAFNQQATCQLSDVVLTVV